MSLKRADSWPVDKPWREQFIGWQKSAMSRQWLASVQPSGKRQLIGNGASLATWTWKSIRARLYVAEQQSEVVAFAAGHLTRRFDCDGELEWINVAAEARGRGLADELLRKLACWFIEQGAKRICVDVVPENIVARRFYARLGARQFRPCWLVWDDIGACVDR